MDYEFLNDNKYKYIIFILPGMNTNYYYYLNLINYINKKNSKIKIIVLEPPLRDINFPEKKLFNVKSWYDYYTQYDGEILFDSINIKHFNEEIDRINFKIMREVKKINYKYKKIILIGFSQGGTLAIHLALTSKYKIGGIVCLHSIFLCKLINNYNKLNKIPIYLISGNKDEIYNINLQKFSYKNLFKYDFNINWTIKNLYHCQDFNNQEKFIYNIIKKIFNL